MYYQFNLVFTNITFLYQLFQIARYLNTLIYLNFCLTHLIMNELYQNNDILMPIFMEIMRDVFVFVYV